VSEAPSLELRLRPAGSTAKTVDLVVSTLAIYVLSLALPVMTLQVYDRVLPNATTGTLPVLAAGVCVAIVLEVLLRLARGFVIGWTGAAYEHRLSCAAVNHLLAADLTQLAHHGVAGDVHRLGAIARLKDFYSGQALTTIIEVAFVLIFLGLIAYIGGLLVVVPLAVLIIFFGCIAFFGLRLRRTLAHRSDTDDARYNFLIESLGGIHTIKAFALENPFLRRHEALEAASSAASHVVSQAGAQLVNAGTIFSHVMIAGVVTVGAGLVIEGTLTVGALIASLLLSGRITQPVQRALLLWVRYQDFRLTQEKVASLFEAPRLVLPKEPPLTSKEGELELRNVGFRFPGSEFVFREATLCLRRGEAVALSGAQGSGKSLLLKLIAGMYAPSEGEILVDGAPTTAYPLSALIDRVGLISDQAVIFRGTIRDNITRFGEVRETQAREVATLLGIDREVARLPNGFDTMLEGTLADSIAPGLQQRIAIARVLATKPRIILFDEADRGLDRNGYNLLYRLLGQLRSRIALILVSDDRNLCQLATRNYILQDGQLAEAADLQGAGPDVKYYRELRL
jgi:ATP-binding cassette, subfamily C, bacterial LapB